MSLRALCGRVVAAHSVAVVLGMITCRGKHFLMLAALRDVDVSMRVLESLWQGRHARESSALTPAGWAGVDDQAVLQDTWKSLHSNMKRLPDTVRMLAACVIVIHDERLFTSRCRASQRKAFTAAIEQLDDVVSTLHCPSVYTKCVRLHRASSCLQYHCLLLLQLLDRLIESLQAEVDRRNEAKKQTTGARLTRGSNQVR